MRTFIAAHADAIVALVSASFIAASSISAIDDLRSEPFGKDNASFTRGRPLMSIAWIAFLLTTIHLYTYASGFA